MQPRWPGGAATEERVSRRHHPHRALAASVHSATGRARSPPALTSDSCPRRARPARQVACRHRSPSGASQASNPPADHARHAHASRARMSGARLLEAGLRYRHRTLPELRRRREDHRRHRRSAGEGANPRPSGLANPGAATRAGALTRSLPGSLSIRHRFAGSADGRARPALARTAAAPRQ